MREESRAVLERYRRRTRTYDPLDAAVYLSRQEVERGIIWWLRHHAPQKPNDLRLLEIGCGSGGNLLQLLRLGLDPEKLIGNELQDDLLSVARQMLPRGVRLIGGDALDIAIPNESLDTVFQSLVFSSLLDDEFQVQLARRMWAMVRPGGGILWYDFIYDNPSNPDVRGVPRSRILALFPEATIVGRRLTLAPPLARVATRLSPALYSTLNVVPLLRTHFLAWIKKTPSRGERRTV